jgi:SAM-dependent methyltransferase
MIDIATFWDRAATKYAASKIADIPAYEYTLERTRSYLGAGDSVIELGCGTGSTALRLAESAGRIVASDISPNMTAIGRDKAAAAGIENVDFVVGDVMAGTLPAGPYDVVMGFNLFHLIRDRAAAFRAVAAMVKPGGLFISKTVCIAEGGGGLKLRAIKLALPVMQWLGRAPYVGFMRIAELERDIEAAGFEIIETGNYPARPPSRYVVARKKR